MEYYDHVIINPVGLLSPSDKEDVEHQVRELINTGSTWGMGSYHSDSPLKPPRYVTANGDNFFAEEHTWYYSGVLGDKDYIVSCNDCVGKNFGAYSRCSICIHNVYAAQWKNSIPKEDCFVPL